MARVGTIEVFAACAEPAPLGPRCVRTPRGRRSTDDLMQIAAGTHLSRSVPLEALAPELQRPPVLGHDPHDVVGYA